MRTLHRRATIRPSMVEPRDPERALPFLLVLTTMVTGLVDAVSYLKLGQVFVANMTGNIQFAAFSFAGARGLPLASGFLAIASFLLGAVAAGRLGAGKTWRPGRSCGAGDHR